jgi:cold shock CspA family protein
MTRRLRGVKDLALRLLMAGITVCAADQLGVDRHGRKKFLNIALWTGRNLDQDENEPAFNVGKWGIEMNGLDEGQKVSFEVVADRRTGKSSAGNLRTV